MSAWHPDWPGFNPRGSLLLPLPADAFAPLPDQLGIDGIALARKGEFHVTLLDRALGARVQAAGEQAALPALFAALDWQWRRSGERWLLREAKDGVLAHSLIELVEMPALGQFRRALARELGEPVAAAPAHVTLYTAGDPTGIGLASQEEFERLRVKKMGSEAFFN
jgi:hypothetical protein